MDHEQPTAASTPHLETSTPAHWGVLIVVMALPSLAAWLYFIALSGSAGVKPMYFGSKVVQFAIPALWMAFVQKQRLQRVPPDVRSIRLGAMIGAAMVAAGCAAYFGYLKHQPRFANVPESIGTKLTDMGLTSPVIFLVFAVFISVPHSLLEEYYWRWFTFGQLRRVIPWKPAAIISSLGFMAHHVIVIEQLFHGHTVEIVFFSLCVAFGGAVWAWVYQRTGSLYGAWASHFLVDCGIMFLGYDIIDWGALAGR